MLVVPYTRRRKAEQLLASAGVEAEWAGPPSGEEIRLRDQERLLSDPMLNEALTGEDLTLAQKLLEDRGPEAVAAALVRLHRSRMPAPEELFDDVRDRSPSEPRPARPERGPRPEAISDGVWFRMPVGRSKNADPKWILPMICRLGHVTKKDIGQIRIFDRETKFEISKAAEERFREAIKAAGSTAEIPVEASEPPGAAPPRRPGPPRNRDDGDMSRPPRRDFGPRPDSRPDTRGDTRPDRGPPRGPRGDGPPPRGPRSGPPGAGFAGPKGPKKPWDPTAPKGPKGPGKPRKPRD